MGRNDRADLFLEAKAASCMMLIGTWCSTKDKFFAKLLLAMRVVVKSRQSREKPL